jgi:mono/diheme cytochrome c family protein
MARGAARGFALAAVAVALAGCHQDMWNQKRYEPLEVSAIWPDGRSSRMPVTGTVEYKKPRLDDHLYTGIVAGQWVESFPFTIDEAVLARGQERYEIHCTPCHGRTGAGDGMIIQRGMAAAPELEGIKVPPPYWEERLLESPPGYFYDVITNGFGTMFPYASRIEPEDRWAIVAYVRVLQEAHQASPADVPESLRAQLAELPENAFAYPEELKQEDDHGADHE